MSRYHFDIKALGAECEANYRRIMRLLPDMAYCENENQILLQRRFSVDERNLVKAGVEISVTDISAYTTSIEFLWLADVDNHWAARPLKFQVRIYHDVRSAEVISVNAQRAKLARYAAINEKMFAADEKRQQNEHWGELLSLSLRYGREIDVKGAAWLQSDNATVN